MKRVMHRGISFFAATILGVAAAVTSLAPVAAFAPAAFAQEQAPNASRSQTEAPSTEPQKASGVVPPGVKLAPQMPGPGAPRPFHFPKAATMTLPNGLRVFVVTDHSEPAIAARLVILSAGSIKDPAGMPGVAQMAANLLTQGTEKRSAKEIAEGIDFIGGSLNAMAGRDATTVTLDIVKKDLATGMDLMSDVVLHPTFRAEELDRQRQQLLSTLQVQYADPEYLATLVFARAVYGASPYGLPPEGTPATVQKFQPEDFVKFHDANYAPNQSLLGFAGDITPEEAFAVAQKYFGGWPKVDVPLTEPAAPSATTAQHIWLIDKPDAVQTQIRIGKIGIPRNDPDFLPLDVTNHILGGSYNSRLNTEVRIKKGLTYGASSSMNPHRYTGSLVVSTYTRTEATVEATKLVMDILNGMSQGEITQKELDFARDYLAGVYPIASETAEQVTDRVLTVAAFGLPEDYNQTYPAKIRATSLKDVQAMARKYFATGDLDLVLAGNISAFRDALKKAFPTAEFTEIPYDQVNVLAPDLRAPKQETLRRALGGIARTGQANPAGRGAGCGRRGAAIRRDSGNYGEWKDSRARGRPAAGRELAGRVSGPLLRRGESGRHDHSAGLRWEIILAEISERDARHHQRDRRIQARHRHVWRWLGTLPASAGGKNHGAGDRRRKYPGQENAGCGSECSLWLYQIIFRCGYAPAGRGALRIRGRARSELERAALERLSRRRRPQVRLCHGYLSRWNETL